jgi:hypothetical protein
MEAALDQVPAGREIAIAGWQGPDRMQMIRQGDERIDGEGMIVPGRGDRLAQGGDMVDEQGCRRSTRLTVKKKHPPGTNARR